MWAFDALGLADDADERDIKRAYAKRLKLTRPDEDPAGFQRLHDAYKAALDHARDRAWRVDEDTHDAEGIDDTPAPPIAATEVVALDEDPPQLVIDEPKDSLEAVAAVAEPVALDTASQPNETEESETFDLPAFLDEGIAHLSQDDPTALRHWLESQPALWSLQMKPHIGRWLLQALDERDTTVPVENFDVMLHFFDMDHVLSGVDAWFLHDLRWRLQLRHELLPGNEYALANRVAADTAFHERLPLVRRAMRQLRKPFSWESALWFALPYGRAPQMRRIVGNLDGGRLDRLGDAFDAHQVQFWVDAGDTSRMSKSRRAVAMARSIALVWTVGLVALAVRWLVADIAPHEVASESLQAAMLLVGGPIVAYALWEAWIVAKAYFRWQGAPEGADVQRPVLRLLWVPMLAALTVVDYLLGFTTAAAWLGALTCVTGLLRLAARANLGFSFAGWRLIFLLPFLKGVFGLGALAIVYPFVSAGLGATFWLIDALRHARVLWNAMRDRLGRRALPDSGT